MLAPPLSPNFAGDLGAFGARRRQARRRDIKRQYLDLGQFQAGQQRTAHRSGSNKTDILHTNLLSMSLYYPRTLQSTRQFFTTKCFMILRSPTEHEKGRTSFRANADVGRGLAIGNLRSCRHGLPASRPAGCVRTHPCQPGFRQSMPERRARIVMFMQLTQI